MAHDAGDLGRCVVDQSTTHFFRVVAANLAVRTRRWQPVDDNDTHGFVLGKVALDVDDTDGQEAGLAKKGTVGSLVDVDGTMGVEGV